MRRKIALLLVLVLSATSIAKADILVLGTDFKDCCFIPNLITDSKIVFQHKDSSLKYDRTIDLIIFRNSCSNTEISKVKHIYRKGNVTFAVESDSSRAGIDMLIPSETAISNAKTTSFCDCSNSQLSYAIACCWYRAVTGKDAMGSTFKPEGIRDEVIGVLQQCGNEAALNPGTTSQIDEHWYLPALNSHWKGKRVVFFGDSITDKGQLKSTNDIYWHILEKLLGIQAFVYGISGHEMSHILGQAEKMEKEIGKDFDAIIIFAGTNDYNSSIPLGDWYTLNWQKVNDHGEEIVLAHRNYSKDGTTFKGRVNIVLDSLKSHFPDKQIIMMTPIHRSWANFGGNNVQPEEKFCNRIGVYINSYVECIREASSVWSVPVIDLFSEAGIHPEIESHGKFFRSPTKNEKTGYHDLLHPNTEGHIRIAYTVAYKLMSIPCFPR